MNVNSVCSELDAVAGELRQVQEGESGAESDDEGALNDVGAGDKAKRCTKCVENDTKQVSAKLT